MQDLKLCCAYSCAPVMDSFKTLYDDKEKDKDKDKAASTAKSNNFLCFGRRLVMGPPENRVYMVISIVLATVPSVSFIISTYPLGSLAR